MEKLKTSNTFREFHDYLVRTGQIPYDEFLDIDFEELTRILGKTMPNLQSQRIIIESTPNEKKGFFYELWNNNKLNKS